MKETVVVTPCGPDLSVLSKMMEQFGPSMIIIVGGLEIGSQENGNITTIRIKTVGGIEEISEIIVPKDMKVEIFETQPGKIHDTIEQDTNQILDILNAYRNKEVVVNITGGDVADNIMCTWVGDAIPFKRFIKQVVYGNGCFQNVPRFKRRKSSDGLWQNDKIEDVILHFLNRDHGNTHYYSLESVHMHDGTKMLFFRREQIAQIDLEGNLFFLDIYKNAPLRMSLKVRSMADKMKIPHNKQRK